MVSSKDTEIASTAATAVAETGSGTADRPDTTVYPPEGTDDATGAATTEEGRIEVGVYKLRFTCLDNTIYHSSREAFFARCHRMFTGFQVLAATAAVGVFLTSRWPDAAPWITLTVAVVGVVNLVMDPSGRARDHYVQRQRYYELLATIEEALPTEDLLRKWNGALHRLYANDGPPYYAVKALSYNAAVRMFHEDEVAENYRMRVPFVDRVLANLYPFGGRIYKRLGSVS